jgi:TfoX/Sxy family transcriptional regulator of competence genes
MMTAEALAASVRRTLSGEGAVREVKMFGGIGFMLNGNLIAGASRRGLLVRVGRERERRALAKSGARRMLMRGRTLEGWVYVDPPALSARAVQAWMRLALPYVSSLPRKARPGARRTPSRRTPRGAPKAAAQ